MRISILGECQLKKYSILRVVFYSCEEIWSNDDVTNRIFLRWDPHGKHNQYDWSGRSKIRSRISALLSLYSAIALPIALSNDNKTLFWDRRPWLLVSTYIDKMSTREFCAICFLIVECLTKINWLIYTVISVDVQCHNSSRYYRFTYSFATMLLS